MNRYKYDWTAIRAMYEAGNSPAYIEKQAGMPTRQAIWKRAHEEGWQRVDEVDETLELIPFEGLTDEQRIVVREMAHGLPQRHAAAIAGVCEDTVGNWKKSNPAFRRAVQAATAVFARQQLGKIEESKDWRAGLALLERHPATRTDFAPPNSAKAVGSPTFNVLGHVHVGFDRGDDLLRIPAEPAVLLEAQDD